MRFKKVFFILIFLLVSCFVFSEESLTISKIRIIIQDAEYLWTKETDIELVNEIESFISPYTVVSYSSLFPGKKITQENLEEEVKRTQLRLSDSGLFYTASVEIVPPRKNPAERTIIISVTEGFLHRFSGGYAYAMYGLEGLGGKRSSLYTYAGWNLLGLSWAHENLFNKGYILAASAESRDLFPSLVNESKYEHSLSGGLHAGKYLTSDLGLTLYTGLKYTPSMQFFSDLLFYTGPVIRVHRYEFKPFDFSWNTETSAFWFVNQESCKIESKWAFRKNFFQEFFEEKGKGQKLNLSVSLSGGYENDSAPFSIAFNLYDTADRSVRSGYSKEALIGSSYCLFSSELRWNSISLKIPPAFSCIPQVFLYTDIAFVDVKDTSSVFSLRDAFGGGARILLDNPIFAYFTFAFGWNHEGKGRFVFSATGGY